ncbi:hypothetical protein BGZ65_007334 [Modicella reniformis]|uniref:Uncharacterized protein n=1 Tax=Modicella reniformis TaxID=1440133 RepID=A0A9P6M8E4_9FUNG|nr:hypothetical protein BGZ65_007334 [Modicella reniformis]
MGSILAAEKRERAAARAAQVAAAAEEEEARERHGTPEQAAGHSYASSSTYPSSQTAMPSSKTGRRTSSGHKRRHGNSYHEPAATYRPQEADDVEQQSVVQTPSWNSGHPYKARRKRANPVCASHGRKSQNDGQIHGAQNQVKQYHPQCQYQQTQGPSNSMDVSAVRTVAGVESVMLRAADVVTAVGDDVDEMECGEDAEIDVVSI